MPRTVENEKLSKQILNLYAGDWEKLRGYYPDVPTGLLIRRLIRAHIEKIEAANQVPPTVEIGL